MKIRTKINIAFLSIFLVVILAIGSAIGIFSRIYIRTQAQNYLSSSARARAEHIRTFLQDQKKTSSILAAASVYHDFLTEPVGTPNYFVIKDKVDKRQLRTLKADTDIYEAFILDRNGFVVSSSDPSQVGKDKSSDPYFLNAQKETYIKDVYVSETIGKINYTISSPILDDPGGEFLGVSVLRYLPDIFFSIVKSENGLGDTEENFLIDRKRYFITPSRFFGDSVLLKEQLKTKNALECFNLREVEYITKNGYSNLQNFSGHDTFVEAKDYRNVDVIGTHLYIPETGWCLITKVDRVDLLRPGITLMTVFTVIAAFSILIFIYIGSFISKKITNPISDLHKGMEIIESGDLDYRIAVSSHDEIGDLSGAFNSTASKLKESRQNIEQKVKDRTSELERINKAMTNRELKMIELKKEIKRLKDKK